MNAEIITIGDEILIGQIVDTNSQWIGQQLNKIGISVYQISSIQDNKKHIINALKEAECRADIIIITGGLGPTKDDITKKTLAEYFNDDKIIEYPEVIEHIKNLFIKINHPFKEIQRYQAQLPSKATLLKNEFGTAPGMWFYENDKVFVSLPGVPYEMKGLMTSEVLPRLQKKYSLPFIQHKTIHTFGQGESIIAERIANFENNLPNFVKLAYLPSTGKVRLRLSGRHTNKEILEQEINKLVIELQTIIPDIIAGYGKDGALEKYVGILLKQQGKTLATAESMTGGKLASTIVSVSGASNYYKGSFITYSSKLKETLLGIPKEIIKKHTAVSKEVTRYMAIATREKLKTDYAIAITGNASPTADTHQEVGVVFIAITSKKTTEVYEFNFGQPREKVINRTVTKALELLQKSLLK